jgi:fucose 4-O-acetylase-like acetyltransferase
MKRVAWVDYARGIAIFGVVMWHVVGGVVNSDIPTTEGMVAFGDIWDMYTFRLMPIFFFLSGAFFVRSLSRPFMKVLTTKIRTIVYPYFLWSLVMLIIGTLTVRFRNGTETLTEFPRLFYDPILHFWFLFALFVIMMAVYVAHRLRISRWLVLLGTLALFVWSASTIFYTVWYVIGQIGYFAIYFVAGYLVGSDFIKRVEATPLAVNVGMLALGGVILAAVPVTGLNVTALIWQPLAATIAMLMTINLSVIMARYSVLSFVRYWGDVSLEIYLVHVLALSSTRIVLYNLLGIENAWLHIIAGIIIGMYAPIVLRKLSDMVGTDILFVAPRLKPSSEKSVQIAAQQ